MQVTTNADQVREQVRDLSVKINRAVTRDALRTAGNVIKKRAAANLRAQGSRTMAKDLFVSSKVTHTTGQAQIGAKRGTRLGRLGHLMERGTRPHTIMAGGKRGRTGKKLLADVEEGIVFGRVVKHPGARAKPWLEPAIEDAEAEVIQVFEEAILTQIAKAQGKGLL